MNDQNKDDGQDVNVSSVEVLSTDESDEDLFFICINTHFCFIY